jgi:hypothetical protein
MEESTWARTTTAGSPPAPDSTADEDLFFPCCFRDGSEIRRATDGEER